jgi:hypothetical protein
MYRVFAIVGASLILASCGSTPDWMKVNTDMFKPQPAVDTVRFESEPPGAEAKVSAGQSCRTPCSLALSVNAPTTVTFSLPGYQPDIENLEPVANTGSATAFQPNPVVVELIPAPPPPKPVKKPEPPKKKSTPKPKPAASAAPAQMATPQQQAPAPWPGAPAPSR